MANVASSFIEKFHAVQGTTIGERRANFFKLVYAEKTSLNTSPDAVSIISANLTPKTHLEGLFKLDLLIYFRRTSELLPYLAEGDDVFLSKISKQNWFFQDAFGKFGAEELVNQVLPSTSYSVRMKILGKLVKCFDEEQFDKIFDAVAARYGVSVAAKFLMGCSAGKIKEILATKYIVKQLTSANLKVMYKKNPDLVKFYFDNYDTNSTRILINSLQDFLRFLWTDNQALFEELQNKHKFSLKLGIRNTKKFAKIKRDEIIKSPLSYLYKIHMKTFIRKIGKDTEKLYCNVLPPDFDDLRRRAGSYSEILECIPKKYKYKFKFLVPQKFYNKQFINHPTLIDEKLLTIIPDNQERSELAKIKVDQGADDFIKYLKTDESIPMIKERINLTSNIADRSKFIKTLIETCHINNDLDALLLVIKYFCGRHKNDDFTVHMQFFNTIGNYFSLQIFNEEMWQLFNDLLLVHALKFDQSPSTYEKIQTLPLVSFNRGISDQQRLSYLFFLFRKNELTDDLVYDYLASYSFPYFGHYSKDFEKYFVLFAIKNSDKIVEKMKQDDPNAKENYECKLIEHLDNWNKCYKNDQISFYDFPNLLRSFEVTLQELSYIPYNIEYNFKNKIFTLDQNQYRSKFIQIYWSRCERFLQLQDVMWFLKYEPQQVVDNLENVLTNILVIYQVKFTPMMFDIKKYSHLHQLDEQCIEHCYSVLKNKPELSKTNYIKGLAILLTPQKYVELADSYKPTDIKLDLSDEESVRNYKIRTLIAENFKFTKDYKTLDSLLNYFKGDYLKPALTAFSSLLYKTPENQVSKYLNLISGKAVSVRKHALFFACRLSDVSTVEIAFKTLIETEKDGSIQKRVFKSAVNYFIQNPQDRFFEIVKSNMVFVKSKDDESLHNMTTSFIRMPAIYQAPYVQFCWEYLEKIFSGQTEKLLRYLNELLARVNYDTIVAKNISIDFLFRIIKENFNPKEDGVNICKIFDFAFDFLTYRQEKIPLLQHFFEKVDEFKSVDKIFWLFRSWYEKLLNLRLRDFDKVDFLEYYINFWQAKINPVDHFKDFIKIFFLTLKKDLFVSTNLMEDFSRRVVTFLDCILMTYGPFVLGHVEAEFANAAKSFTTEKVSVYDLYNCMITNSPTAVVAVLLINVLPPNSKHMNSEYVSAYNSTVEKIRNIDDLGVKIKFKYTFT